uniref:Uncharacterized protein n=1 Tax=Desulfobacca acetoxidans TaxID=60893 RepID=A0A7V4LD54_9BACT
MAETLIREVPGGYEVDGLLLVGGKCRHGEEAPFQAAGRDCCHTYSSVSREGNLIAYFGKMTAPSCPRPYEWGYRITKGGVVVDVLVYDCQEPQTLAPGGHRPPPLSAWRERGWEVLAEFCRPFNESAG